MDTKLIQAFNKQINHEFYSAYLYFAMSTYFSEIVMLGFSRFMKKQAILKLNQAQKIYDYIILRDEKLIFQKIEEPASDWINVSDVFSSALAHEEFMLNQIQELYLSANQCQDFGALEYISKLLDIQIKRVGCFKKIVFKIKNSNIVASNIEILDEKINTLNIK